MNKNNKTGTKNKKPASDIRRSKLWMNCCILTIWNSHHTDLCTTCISTCIENLLNNDWNHNKHVINIGYSKYLIHVPLTRNHSSILIMYIVLIFTNITVDRSEWKIITQFNTRLRIPCIMYENKHLELVHFDRIHETD